MKKMKAIQIKAEDLRRGDFSCHRKALIDAGVYGRPGHKVHKSVKDYTRKVKHKKNLLGD